MGKSLTLSVHQLVDFLLRTGDIDTRVFNRSSMTEGSRRLQPSAFFLVKSCIIFQEIADFLQKHGK